MSYTLDASDHLIFNELSIDPFQSYNSISKKVNLAPATVKDRILNMKKNGFLRSDRLIVDPVFGKRQQTGILASYFPPSLGLIRLNVLFENIADSHKLRNLIRFCNEHPYTHYRGLSFKKSVSLFAQFDIPVDALNEMKSVLNEVQSILKIGNILIYETSSYFHSIPDFTKWSLFKRNWEIAEIPEGSNDFILDTMWSEFIEKNEKSLPDIRELSTGKNKPMSLSLLDAKLLRELTINAKVPLDFLTKTYERSKSVISRYISRLKENVIHKGTLLYDESFFGLNNLQIIFGKFADHSILSRDTLLQFLKSSSLPFSSNLYCNSKYFVLETMASSTLSTETARFIWHHTDPEFLNVNQLHIPSTLVYYFYHENLNDDRKWKTETDYIKDTPLSNIENN